MNQQIKRRLGAAIFAGIMATACSSGASDLGTTAESPAESSSSTTVASSSTVATHSSEAPIEAEAEAEDRSFSGISELIDTHAVYRDATGKLVDLFPETADRAVISPRVSLGEWLPREGPAEYSFELLYGCHRVAGLLTSTGEPDKFRWTAGLPSEGGVEFDMADCPVPEDLPELFSLFPGSQPLTLVVDDASLLLSFEGYEQATWVP